MTTHSLLDLLGWIEAAVFALASIVTVVYVPARLLIAAVRCGSATRALALVAGAVAFLLGWGFLIFTGIVVTMMAVVSDVQASPNTFAVRSPIPPQEKPDGRPGLL